MVPISTAAIVAAFVVVNLAIVVIGYYIGIKHVDRLLDIEEGEANPDFPPGFGARERERIGPLSAEDIDDIDEWESLSGRDRHRAGEEADDRRD